MAHCPECGEEAVHRPPNDLAPWLRECISAGRLPAPEWSHLDGEPLCPVMGDHGYEPAQPVE